MVKKQAKGKNKPKVTIAAESDDSEAIAEQKIEARLAKAFQNQDDESGSDDNFENSYGSENQENTSQKGERTLKFSGNINSSQEEDFSDGDDISNDKEDRASMFSGEEAVSVDLGDQVEDLKSQDPAAVEERRKQRRIEKLEKRITLLTKKKAKSGTKKPEKYEREASEIKNKHKRQEVVLRRRMAANQDKKIASLKTRKLREELGEEAVPKGKNATIEGMRVPDETMIDDLEDEDIVGEQNIDEFDKYFNRETTPKILVTTNRRPKGKIFDFLKELKITIPNIEYYPRENFKIKEIIEWSKERDFTDIMIFQEKWGNPHSMILSHLPDGPTATFRVSSVKLNAEIPNHGANNGMMVAPELILNNFDTMLGSRMGRMIAALFPQDPELRKRRVITWHNQRDFIFFRHHRYEFNPDGTRANLAEVGPRFTLKLHKLQLGTLDSKFGEYEFLYKPKDGVNRKKFFL